MDWEGIYHKLIETRRELRRKKGEGIYLEIHHIEPTSCGGKDIPENKVLLTAREHFIAHLLLAEMYTGEKRAKMIYALFRLCHRTPIARSNHIISARQYERIKKLYAECPEIRRIKSIRQKGKKLTDAHKAALRKPKNLVGKPKRVISEENRLKINKALLGRKMSESQKNAIVRGRLASPLTRGYKLSEERIEKMIETSKLKKRVLDESTGISYESAKAAARALQIPFGTFKNYMTGRECPKNTFVYC